MGQKCATHQDVNKAAVTGMTGLEVGICLSNHDAVKEHHEHSAELYNTERSIDNRHQRKTRGKGKR